jgi:hypothetical protein
LYTRRTALFAVAIAGVVILALFLPAVPYTVSFADPNNLDYAKFSACIKTYTASHFDYCRTLSAYPPSELKGYGSVANYFFGVPLGPFPELMVYTKGNLSYLLHFSGPSISYFEGPYYGPKLDFNPVNVVKVDNVSISQWAFGMLNFSAHLTNIGKGNLSHVGAYFQYPGFGQNSSFGQLRWYHAPGGECAGFLLAGTSCRFSMLLNQTSRLLADQSYPMTLEVQGNVGGLLSNSGFLYLYSAQIRYPGVGLNSHWVEAFINELNHLRNGSTLTENRTLDQFAAFRFVTIRSQYDISDYNFDVDYFRFFQASHPMVFEEILYPSGRDPVTYPGYLQQNAPGHYAALVDPVYHQYGYFFGSGPSVDIGPGCPATEIPGPNINITQYIIDHGCSYVITNEIWFILILGS